MNKRRSDGKRDAPYWEPARACAYCDSINMEVRYGHPALSNFWVECLDCGARGPVADTKHNAISAHNSRVSDKPSAAVEKYVRLRRKLEKE